MNVIIRKDEDLDAFCDLHDLGHRLHAPKRALESDHVNPSLHGLAQTAQPTIESAEFFAVPDLQRLQLLRGEYLSGSSQRRLERWSRLTRRLAQGFELRHSGLEMVEPEDPELLEFSRCAAAVRLVVNYICSGVICIRCASVTIICK